jgi:hypothetical protein
MNSAFSLRSLRWCLIPSLLLITALVAGCGGSGSGEGAFSQKFEMPPDVKAKVDASQSETVKHDLSGKGRRSENEEK